MLVQIPLQLVSPAWQLSAHAPFTHKKPAGHTVPHAPQLALLERRSTQMPPHATCPVGHGQVPPLTAMQTPCTHALPAGHTCPQAPQFAESMLVYVQMPLQFVVPLLHPHVPLGSQ